MTIKLDIEEVMRHLPHRHPFLFIDRVIDFVPYESLKAIKNVTSSEPWFTGHFPNMPVMPGVLMLECMAQAAAIMAYLSLEAEPDNKSLFYLAGIDNARFKQIVKPGDQLVIHVNFIKQKNIVWKISGKIFVNDIEVCSADITSAKKEI